MGALQEGNSNKMAKSNGKRNIRAVDLTGDSDDDSPASHKSQKRHLGDRPPRGTQQVHDTTATTAVYPTPPSSGLPSSSQRNDGAYGCQAQRQHTAAERASWLTDDEDDYNEAISSTQAAVADTAQLHHYGDLPTKIVGVQYYRGFANSGEQILMKREPSNPYDRNAIRVDNVANVQIGHIPRRIAAKFAKFMDNTSLHVEGELAGQIGTFDCPLVVRMYGPDPETEEGVLLAGEMKAEKLPLKAAEQAKKQREKEKKEAEKRQQQLEKQRLAEARRAAASGGTGSGARLPSASQHDWVNQSQAGPSAQPVMADILDASQRFNPRETCQATDRYGMKEAALQNMPLASQPKSVQTTMLPYQLQALQWLLDQENPQPPPSGSSDSVQLWKRYERDDRLFTNVATTFSTKDAPKLASGGILADDMGLGKTLEMISLIVSDKEKAGSKTGPTLICCPLSVMSNWRNQADIHLHEDKKLKIHVYHGAGRVQTMGKSDFSTFDVVITTYHTLCSDYMSKAKAQPRESERQLRASGLYSVPWRRVILDEGHAIRNPVTKGAAAVTALTAQSRWVLTGTPIVNSLRDLYSLLRFVGITGGLENLEVFNRVLIRPLKQGDPSATFLLQAIMTAFTLRRRKDMAFIDLRLPRLDEYVHRIEFTAKERERYDALCEEARGMLVRYEKKGGAPAYQHLLEILLRMRQCCNHWQLCGERVTNLLAQLAEHKAVQLTPDNKKALQEILQVHIWSQEECAICLDSLHDPVITTCGHFFGRDCIAKVIETQKKCPMCRAELIDDSCLVMPAHDCGDETADEDMDLTQSSSKIETMMQILTAVKAEGDKTVVFSQWTRFLDLVESRLASEGYNFCRIDGTMSAQQRDTALDSLDQDPKCTVMLASLGVCAVGLNLTAANNVILSDTWWAPAIEDQAVDRVHRLGQQKETRVFRLIMNGSIEDETIRIQQEKRKLMQLAFTEKEGKRDKVQTGRLGDIQRLLRPMSASPPTGTSTSQSQNSDAQKASGSKGDSSQGKKKGKRAAAKSRDKA